MHVGYAKTVNEARRASRGVTTHQTHACTYARMDAPRTYTHMHAHVRMHAHTDACMLMHIHILSCLIAADETVTQAKKWQLE